MMDKQHEYILKAFIEAKIPKAIRRNSPELMVIDSVYGFAFGNLSSYYDDPRDQEMIRWGYAIYMEEQQ